MSTVIPLTTPTSTHRLATPPKPPRIDSAFEALWQFDELVQQCMPIRIKGTDQTVRRVPTRLLSPRLVEKVVALGGDEELSIEQDGAGTVTVRLVTVALLILREVPAPTEWRSEPFELPTYLSTASYVPLALEVFKRRYHLLGLQPGDSSQSVIAEPEIDAEKPVVSTIDQTSTPTQPTGSGLDAGVRPETSRPNAPFRIQALKRRGAFPLSDGLEIEVRLEQFKKAGFREKEGSAPALTQLKDRLWRQPALCDQKTIQSLDVLRQDFPNFSPLLDMYAAQLQLKRLVRAPLVLRPTLMVGPPGIGKTVFMHRFCKALNLVTVQCAVATLTAGWILSGRHNGWRAAAPGLIAQAVLGLPDRHGLGLWLDEIDKLPSDQQNSPVMPILLELLEPLSRQTFKDEFLEVSLNLLPLLSVVATANTLQSIPPPLLSRFQVVEIPAPTRDQMPAVIRSVDRSMREAQPGLKLVFAPLEGPVTAALGLLTPRQAYQALEGAYGLAAMRSRTGARGVKVTVADVQNALKQSKCAPASSEMSAKAKRDLGSDEIMLLLFHLLGGNTRGGGSSGGGSGGQRIH